MCNVQCAMCNVQCTMRIDYSIVDKKDSRLFIGCLFWNGIVLYREFCGMFVNSGTNGGDQSRKHCPEQAVKQRYLPEQIKA